MNLFGPDVSHYQEPPDWAALDRDPAFAFAFIKATQGTSYGAVSYFEQQFPLLAKTGLVPGAYHFGVAEHPEEQADYFVDTVTRVHGGTADVLLALDLEHNPAEKRSTPEHPAPRLTMSQVEAKSFLARVKQRTGGLVGLYVGDKSWAQLGQDWTWIARYGPKVDHPDYDFWQYTDGKVKADALAAWPSSIPGSGHCDVSRFAGDIDRLRSLTNGGTARARPAAAASSPAASATAPPVPTRLLRRTTPMLHGADVRTWQDRLVALGHHVATDGVFGPATESATRAAQAALGVAGDGIVGPATWRAAWPG